MSELSRIAREIEKKKNLELNLPKYMNAMLSSYHRYAHIRLALNYYTFGAVLTEERNAPDSVKGIAERVSRIIRNRIVDGSIPDSMEAGIEEIDVIRSEIMEHMQTLTEYTDCFQIYEYVLNRLEYRFNAEEFPQEYDDDAFVQEIMEYILSDRDNLVMRTKISEVVGQLPLRMTKQRYFEIVKDSFSLYLREEKENLQDMLYMLSTCAALEEPRKISGEWSELHAVYAAMKQTDFQTVTAEDVKRLTEQMMYVAGYIERMSNLYALLQEIVNDVYIILLSMPYALTEAGEMDVCRRIIGYVLEQMESGRENAFDDEEMDEIMDSFEKLEGRQERLYEQFSENDYLLDAMDDLEEMMKSLLVDKLYLVLKQIAKLSSSSIFIELHKKRDTEPVDEAYLEQTMRSFMEAMEQSFQKNNRQMNRARMAATLQMLPAFFRTMEECREYVEQALKNCSDEREKLASVDLIRQLMEQ